MNRMEGIIDRHLDLSAIQSYYEEALKEQMDTNNILTAMPDIPEGLNKETEGVLTAYRNMGTVWMNAGGAVPDPIPYLNLLLTMHRNGLHFTWKSEW